MNYLISILPIGLYLLLIKGMDGFSLSSWKKIIECFIWGIMTCLLCLLLAGALGNRETDQFPIIEEIIKGAPLIVAVHRKRSAFFVETLTYGAAVGAGFGVLENVLYVMWNPQFTLGDAFLRGVGTSLLHIGCSALLATLALVCFRAMHERNPAIRCFLTIAGLLPSIAIHFLYNMFLLPDFIQMIVVVLVFIGLFLLAYSIDEKLIHKWLDLCITNDISLFRSIRQGQLQTTNAGRYLLMAKQRFAPEVFFDICVFLGLYLELSILAKSRLIMKEAGMEIDQNDEEHEMNVEKITELHTLRSNIGISGILLLRPFVNIKDTDEWVMKELL